MDGQIVTLANNTITQLAPNFQPQGWLDSNTLIGLVGLPNTGPQGPNIGVLHLADPLHPEDWGFSGTYLGLVS